MRKFLTGLALLAPAIATAQTLPTRQQSGYDTGYIINCTGLDGVSAARCLVPDRIMVDTNGVPLGTAANPIYVSGGGGGGGTSNATSNQNYTATQAGTGYAVGDVIVRVVNSAPGTGAVAGAYWINETQGTLLSTAPTLSTLTQLPNTIVVSSLPAITGTVGVNNFPTSFGVTSLPALPAGTNAIGSITNTGFASTDSRPPIPNLYIATASGTGYATGDILDKIVVSQASTGAFVNSYWINRTQGSSIGTPTAGSFTAYFATAAAQPNRDSNNDLRIPTVTITETSVSVAANTSTTLVAANTARNGIQIQCDGTAIVGISSLGAALTSAAAAPTVIPTGSYPLYIPSFASKTAYTAYTATAQTCRVTQYAQQ